MHTRFSRLLLLPILCIYMCISLSSCLSVKQLRLFQDIPDSTKLANIKLPKFVPPVVHAGDVLSISIITTDATATLSLNAANSFTPASSIGNSGSASGGGSSTDGGFLVDTNGDVEMPELGKIHVIGLDIEGVRDVVKKRALEYFKDPIVLIRNKNLKLTILGEVSRPGTYNITNEKITLIDFLAYSGDFTSFARRDNILLLRKNDDNTFSSIRINVQNTGMLRSEYYYLRDNDVIYVEPTVGKAYSQDVIFTRNISYLTIALGLFTTLLVLIKR